jgi:ABC-type transporter Mla MlaB component
MERTKSRNRRGGQGAEPAGDQKHDHGRRAQPPSRPSLDVALHSDRLVIALRGPADAEWLLQWLPQTFAAAGGYNTLILDLSRCQTLDDLGLSALVVLLRDRPHGFAQVRLRGLPEWAARRFSHAGVDRALGQGWRGEFQQEEVRFQRC